MDLTSHRISLILAHKTITIIQINNRITKTDHHNCHQVAVLHLILQQVLSSNSYHLIYQLPLCNHNKARKSKLLWKSHLITVITILHRMLRNILRMQLSNNNHNKWCQEGCSSNNIHNNIHHLLSFSNNNRLNWFSLILLKMT